MNKLGKYLPRESKRGKSAQGIIGGFASLLDGLIKIMTIGFKDPGLRYTFALWCVANWNFQYKGQ